MVVAGVLAARGNISLPAVIAGCSSAAVLGDQVGYLIGRRFGPGLRGSRLGRRVGARRWMQAQDAVTRHGPWAVVIGRWVSVLRALVPAVAVGSVCSAQDLLRRTSLIGLSLLTIPSSWWWAAECCAAGVCRWPRTPRRPTTFTQELLSVRSLESPLCILTRPQRRSDPSGWTRRTC